MMRTSLLRAWGVVLFAVAFGCPPPAATQTYLVHTYTGREGLPTPNVRDLAPAPDGAMWFATHAGLARYDGLTWQTISAPVLPTRLLTGVRIDSHGLVWASTAQVDAPLIVGEGESWRLLRYSAGGLDPAEIEISDLALAETDAGPLVGVSLGSRGVLLWRNGWRRLEPGRDLPGTEVRDLTADGDRLLAVTDTTIIALRATTTEDIPGIPATEATGSLLAVSAVPPSTVWLLSTRGLWRIRDGAAERIADVEALGIRAADQPRLRADPPYAVYIGSLAGLWRFDLTAGSLEPLDSRNGLLSGSVSALTMDRDGDIWVASARGASKLVSFRFANFSRSNGLAEDEVSAICEPRPGVLLFGHQGGQITRLDSGSFSILRLAPPEQALGARGCRIMDLHVADNGTTWVVAACRGVGVLGRGGVARWIVPEPPARPGLSSVVTDGSGRVWVGGDDGLFELRGNRLHSVAFPHGTSSLVRRLSRGPDGTVLVSTLLHGVLVLHDGRLEEFIGADDPAQRSVFTTFVDRSGRTWVGTAGGLLEEAGGRIALPSPPVLRIGRPVFQIAEGADGHLWFGTDDGVYEWDGSAPVHHTTADGFVGRETNRAATLLDSRGRLWLGADLGVSEVRQSTGRRPLGPPSLRLTELLADERRLPLDGSVALNIDARSLRFSFAAVSLVDEQALSFRTRLLPLEDRWSEPLPWYERSVRYIGLRPGRYRLEVEAVVGSGTPPATVTSPPVILHGPLWVRWWFILVVALATVALTWLGVSAGVRARYASRLQAEVDVRTRALSESEQRYRRLFDESELGHLLVDPGTGSILDANRAATTLVGLEEGIVVGADLRSPQLSWLQEAVDEVFRSSGSTGTRLVELSRDRSEGPRRLEITASPVQVEGRHCILVSVRDVTAQLRLEAERERASRLESLGLLAGGIAHDFNNILMAVLGNLSLLRLKRGLPEDLEPSVEASIAAIRRAKGLTDKLLTFAKGGAPQRRTIDLAPLIRDTVDLVFSGSSCRCTIHVEPNLWPAFVDDNQLSQVLNNVLINAVQAMSDGGTATVIADNVQLPAQGHVHLEPGPYVELRIADTGAGIAPQHLDRVFDPYFSTKPAGSGLGLAAARSILVAHGGWIEIESALEAGTIATLWLPARPGAVTEAKDTSEPHLRGAGRILVMDDDPALRTLYTEVLTELGYEAAVTADGHSAVEAYTSAMSSQRPFAAVLLDLTVPGGMGGYETLEALRNADPSVRAIVASGYSAEAVLGSHLELGFCAALQKPFTMGDLARVLHEVLHSEID